MIDLSNKKASESPALYNYCRKGTYHILCYIPTMVPVEIGKEMCLSLIFL